MTNIKGLDMYEGPVITTVKREHRDEFIMGWMYGLEMLHHRPGGRPSIQEELDKVEASYPLNAHTNMVLGVGP